MKNYNLIDIDVIFNEDDLTFKSDLCAFFKTIHQEIETANLNCEEPDFRNIYRLMGKKGFLAPNWPLKYGGLGRSMVTLGMVFEGMAQHRIGDTLQVLSILFAGNLILRKGTEYQKQKYLKKLAQGQVFMSILYSEIDAGSDLAGLQTQAKAVADDYYEITGTKTYNLKSMQADFALCAARTNPGLSKYDGISLFIVPLKTNNVQIKQLPTLSNESYCEVQFEKALVHKNDIIGEVDKGWAILNDALGLERTGLDLLAKLIKWIELLNSIINLKCCISEKKATDLYNQLNFKIANAKYFVYEILMSLDNINTLPEIVAATAKFYMGELAYEAIQKIVLVVDWPKLNAINEGKLYSNTLELALKEIPGLTLSAGASELMLETIARIEFFNNNQE